jgi:hypothetical protein
MTCPVCQHNQIKIIDRALLAGADPTSLSRTYGFDVPALRRHQEHLQRKMARAHQRFQVNIHQGLFCKLSQVMEMVLDIVQGARTGGDFKFFLQASREFTRIAGLMHKMAAKLPLDPEFIYCLMASPQWDLQEQSLLPSPFQAMSENRQTLKVDLFAPCPDPALEPEPAAMATLPLETQNPERATANPDPTKPSPHSSETPTGNRPRPKREISAKSAPKSRCPKQNNKINQSDSLKEKNVPKNSGNLLQKLLRRWEKSGKNAGKTGHNNVNIELS